MQKKDCYSLSQDYQWITMDDLVSFCKRFPDAKVEELRYKDKDGAEYIFRDKKWQQLIKLTGGE